MKRVVKAIFEVVRVVVGFAGFVLCMCEAADFTKQIFVFLAGIALISIAALPSLLQREEGLGSLYE